MLTRHPLENPSLAPLGLRTQLSYRRLQWKPTIQFTVFEERMIARFWDKHNRADAPRPLPVEAILHKILPSMAQSNRISKGDFVFEGKSYLTRDIVTLSSVMQWFGTNVGRCFIDRKVARQGRGYHESREFTIKLAEENKSWSRSCDMYTFLSHRCTGRCNNKKRLRFWLSNDPCVHDSRTVTERDKAVIDGLMRWLGTAHGRQYITEFRIRRDLAWKEAGERRRRFYDRRRTVAA